MPFPYVMALHQAPTDGQDHPGFHFHIEIHPPLRKPNLLKYLAGPEIGGGNFLSDTSPEEKAAELRAVSSVHYSEGVSDVDSRAAETLLEPILTLHDRIRDAVVDACEPPSRGTARGRGRRGARRTATRFTRSIASAKRSSSRGSTSVAHREPICLMAEGLPNNALVLPRGARESDCRWRILVDPIDGTRGLMYQKRSAWILTGVAPNRGPETRLRDIVLAVQTEIPLVKQHLADQLWAFRGAASRRGASIACPVTGHALTLHPSRAAGIAHGFATVVPILSRRARRPRRDRRRDRRGVGSSPSRKGTLLRGSIHLDRRPAVRVDRRSRPFDRGSPTAHGVGTRRSQFAARALLPSVRPLHGAHRRRIRRDPHRRRRCAGRRSLRCRRRRRVDRLRQRARARRGRTGPAGRAPAPRFAVMRIRRLDEVRPAGDTRWFQRALDTLSALPNEADPRLRDFFSSDASIYVARAPGRLDVMGGIADYSGSLVLELPLECSTTAILQEQSAPICEVASRRDGRWDFFSHRASATRDR